MSPVTSKIADRLSNGIKRFQPILLAAKTRDLNESDTVIIVTDMLSEVFGFDKYSEVTSEYSIRNTYVDLAIKLEGVLHLLIEVKAIGLDLKEAFIKQAVDYAANQGIDWVILTNGLIWRVYKVSFSKPIDQELVLEVDFQKTSNKNRTDIDTLYLLTREGLLKSSLGEYHTQRQALSRYFLSAMILSDNIIDTIRRDLRKISPGVKIEVEEIHSVLVQEVLKREVVEGDKADEARKKVNRIAGRQRTRATNRSELHDATDGSATDEQAELDDDSGVDERTGSSD